MGKAAKSNADLVRSSYMALLSAASWVTYKAVMMIWICPPLVRCRRRQEKQFSDNIDS